MDLDNNLRIICGLKPDLNKETASCSGEISLLNDYSDGSVIGNCVEKNCLILVRIITKGMFFDGVYEKG